MQINKVTSFVSGCSEKIGETILNKKTQTPKLRNFLLKSNKFLEGESFNPGRGAYYALMGGFVIAPRLLQAREPDEFREILTRDIVTVITILFAMKGLKSGMCSQAQKKAGFPLVRDSLGKNAGKFKRFFGYFNPEGGITALDSKEILARYSRINSKEKLVKMLNLIDQEGGNAANVFNVENQKGVLTRVKEALPFFKNKKEGTPLLDAAKQAFGEDFVSKSNAELIEMVKNPNTSEAIDGLEKIAGKSGILAGDETPITYYARNISANFEWLSLAVTALFLGFGLPKINEQITVKKHSLPTGAAINKQVPIMQTPIHNMVNKSQSNPFKNFVAEA